MSFLKDHIQKLKSGKFGEKSWAKRSDKLQQEHNQLKHELEQSENKRRAKELSKLREVSHQWQTSSKLTEQDSAAGTPSLASYKRAEVSQPTEAGPSLVEIEAKQNPAKQAQPEPQEQQAAEEEKTMTPEEILNTKNRLRKLRQPIKLFGESDLQTYQRLWAVEQDESAGDQQTGQAPDAKRKELKRTLFQQSLKDKLATKKPIELEIGTEKPEEVIGIRVTKNGSHLDYKKFEKDCKELPRKDKWVFILKFIKKVMHIWEEDLADGKADLIFHEDSYLDTKKSLKPLYKLLCNQDLNNEILATLYLLARYAVMKEYVKANDKYYDLGIGNAPWPMGVTMVGIHERSGRSKIFSSQVKHILNDETQKKYVVSIKKLLTIWQQHYPVDPSKNVAL